MREIHKFPFILGSCAVFLAIFLSACTSEIEEDLKNIFRDPNTEPIRAAVKVAVPLGEIAAISMALYQDPDPDPDIYKDITIAKNNNLAIIEFAKFPLASHPLPFSISDEGTVTVYGLWSSSDHAILTVVFTDCLPGVPSFSVTKVNTFPVLTIESPEPGIMLVYANIDIDIDRDSEPEKPEELTGEQQDIEFDRLDTNVNEEASQPNAEINVDMDAWVVRVIDINETPNDFSDDHYNISGGGQYVDVTVDGQDTATGVYQLGLAGIHVSPDCSSNPVGGFAVIQELDVGGESVPVLAQAVLAFEDDCDGKIQVIVATGNYVASNLSDLDFDLTLP